MTRERTRASRRLRQVPSEFQGMWLFALFDLPMITKDDRRRYTKFRKVLLQHGFTKLQYSVYAQYCPSEDASLAKRRTIRGALPPDGQVRLVSITDKQFGAMEVFLGKTSAEPEEPLGQGLLF